MSEDADDVQGLDALVGEWNMEAAFPFDPPVTGRGRVSFEWLSEGSFLVQRWEVEHHEVPDGIAIIGPEGSDGGYRQPYFDTRGVSRVYEMSLRDDVKGDEMTDTQTGYAPINGLEMYYEVHGEGEPLVVLHGAYMTVEAMGEIVPMLAETRKVIAVELQAHGRTADTEHPITYEQMADDVAAFIEHLGIEKADLFGYSMGGAVALQTAVRHPGMVRKLVVASVSYTSDGAHPELFDTIELITPEVFAGSPFEAAYLEVAPNPDDFPKLVEKLKELDMTPFEWDIGGITAPTLLIVGDSDAIRLEHVVEMFRILGGGVMGDLAGFPKSRLAVLPATSHFIPPGSGMLDRADLLAPMIGEFLDASEEGE